MCFCLAGAQAQAALAQILQQQQATQQALASGTPYLAFMPQAAAAQVHQQVRSH